MTLTTWISTLAMFAFIAWSTFGRKVFNPIRVLIPIGILSYFATTYLKDIPSGGNNGLLLIASAAFGACIGGALLTMSRMEYDQTIGKVYTTNGMASIGVLSIMFILRLALVQWVTSHTDTAYQFSQLHHFSLYIIGPAFILMAASMLIVRIVGLFIRVKQTTRAFHAAVNG
ncbi:hypothetical protein [Saccharibacillus sp. JS10]|uniref:hypothetical protein n=1 Tax=Saccharibacillus sp. JS10 TaxID=2950552 RepID=UPI00210867F8|nr:hypothetical protein [Saccharibacillus sp. JS10]MCQ4087896.1 hypothetical protein [Saccharibacillus sp. JS10]